MDSLKRLYSRQSIATAIRLSPGVPQTSVTYLVIVISYQSVQNLHKAYNYQSILICLMTMLTLYDIGDGHDAHKNVFDHCTQTVRRRKLNLGDF